jgi:hypothetical protein
MCIWIFFEVILLFAFVPETFTPILLSRKARRLRKERGDERYHAEIEKQDKNLLQSIALSCYRPFRE